MNLPGYEFIPAPLWLVTGLHVLTLTLHFAAMNFLVGGLVVLLFGKIEGKWDHPVVRTYLKLFPVAMAATVTLGVAPLLFVQLVYHRQVYAASIASGWFWLFIIVAVIAAYYLLYAAAFSRGENPGRRPLFLGLALLAAVYVSFVYSTVFSLAERPDLVQALYASNQSGTAIHPEPGVWGFRWIHALLGAVTVGAFFVGLLGRSSEPVYALGKRFFLWGMLAAMVAGFAYLFTLGGFIVPLMRSAAIWIVLAAIVLSLLSLHMFFTRRFALSGILVFVSLAAMVTVRHTLRLIVLEGHFDPADIPVAPQWSVFAVFLVFFVIALALVAYMLRAYFGGGRERA
jgi:hypothetical protein